MSSPQFVSADQVRAALPMAAAIDAMRTAFAALAAGRAEIPVRTIVSAAGGSALLVMPGRTSDPAALGAKLVSVFPQNQGVPVVQALVVLFDPHNGSPRTILDGAALTAIRTGAASGLATEMLARRDATRVAILGAGVQARTQLEAVRCVRNIHSVAIWSRTRSHAEAFAAELPNTTGDVRIATSVADATRNADVICCATSSPEPLLFDADVPAGAHVNAVGSFTPAMREFDPELLGRAILVVDQREAALAEAGEVIAAVEGGLIMRDQMVELGALVNGAARGRTAPDEVTVFKSVGLAVQDLVAGAWVEQALAAQ